MGTPWILRGLVNWLSLLKALIVREARTRFAGGSLGYAWAIIIPVAWILAITIFFGWIGRAAPIAVDLPIFVTTGMLPYLVFRQVITAMMRTCRAQRHLITFGPARPEDLFTAMGFLEIVNAILVSVAILVVVRTFSVAPLPDDPLTVILGLGLAWALGLSVGRFAAVVSVLSDSAQRLVPILLRPFFWISGIFFVASELPAAFLDILWFNPLLHIVELIRSGWFSNFDTALSNVTVPLVATGIFYFASRGIEQTPGVGTAGLVRA